MIKGLVQVGKYTVVSSSDYSMPYIQPNGNSPMHGTMRVSGNNIEAFDGTRWVIIPSSMATVGLTPDAELLLDWARQKRDEELATTQLAKNNPVIKDLLDKVNAYQDQIEMVKILMKDEVKI